MFAHVCVHACMFAHVCVCVWQILLLSEGEELSALKRLPPEQILLRWLNYHMRAAGHAGPTVTNFGSDLQVVMCTCVCAMCMRFWLCV